MRRAGWRARPLRSPPDDSGTLPAYIPPAFPLTPSTTELPMNLKHLATALVAAVALSGGAHAQQFFRIGTGGTAGTYYPVGGMIANAVSQPGKIIVTAQAANGSLANVNGISGGAIESGFSQSDVATWAQKGTGVFEGKPNVPNLRLIANLFPESVHIVVRKGLNVKSPG